MIEFDAVLVLMIFFGAFILAAVGIGYLIASTGYDKALLQLREPYDDEVHGSVLRDVLNEEHTDAEEDEQQYATLPINPDAPPTWKTYNPRRADAPVKFCRCHGREIQRGQKVLWWPNPETQGVDLLCEDGVAEAEEAKNRGK